jgi:Right handed beta helix region
MISSRVLIGILIALIALGSRFGDSRSSRTFYVDSVSGDDTRVGTAPETAWKTLQKVDSTTFQPGDRILLKSGSVWRGQLWPKGSGKEGSPIILGMYGGGVEPRIEGDGLAEDAVLLKNQEYWEIEHLEISNTGATPGVRRGLHVILDNFGDAHHIYLRRLTIHDVNGSDKDKVNGGIDYTSAGDAKPSRFVDLRIEDNEIYRVDRSGIFGWSDRWKRSKWYPSLGVIVRGNSLSDIGGDGIVVVATDGAVVERNVVAHANQRSEGYDVAIWSWSADNTVVQYNEAYGTEGQRDGEGFDSDWNSSNTVIQYNYSHDNDGGFLLVCNEGGHAAGESAGNVGTIVRYNISQNDRTRGINIAGPTRNTRIYNNTIYVGAGHKVDLTVFSDWNGWATGTFFYDNIFYVDGAAQFSYALSRNSNGAYVTEPGTGHSVNSAFDSNVYYGNVTPPPDPRGLTVNPNFAVVGQGRIGRQTLKGYRLQAGSPAIGSAMQIPNDGGRDFWGTPIPSSSPRDRGAVEHR